MAICGWDRPVRSRASECTAVGGKGVTQVSEYIRRVVQVGGWRAPGLGRVAELRRHKRFRKRKFGKIRCRRSASGVERREKGKRAVQVDRHEIRLPLSPPKGGGRHAHFIGEARSAQAASFGRCAVACTTAAATGPGGAVPQGDEALCHRCVRDAKLFLRLAQCPACPVPRPGVQPWASGPMGRRCSGAHATCRPV